MNGRWAVRFRFGRWVAYTWRADGDLDVTTFPSWRAAQDFADREARR